MASLSDFKVPRGPPRPCPACSEPPSLPLPYLSVSGWGCITPRASPQVGPGWGRTWPLRIWVPRPKPRTRGHPAACEGWGRAQWDIPSCLGAPGSLPLRQGIRRLRQRAQCWWLLLAGEGGLRWAGWDPPPRGHLSQSPISYALAVPSVSSFFFLPLAPSPASTGLRGPQALVWETSSIRLLGHTCRRCPVPYHCLPDPQGVLCRGGSA